MANPAFNPGLNPLSRPTLKTAINTKPPLKLTGTKADMSKARMETKAEVKADIKAAKTDAKTNTLRKTDRYKGPRANPVLSEDSSSSSSSSDSFQVPSSRTFFYDDRRDAKISFDIPVDNTLCIQPLEQVTTILAAKQMSTKLMMNLSTFSRDPDGVGNSVTGYPVYDYYRTIFAQLERKVLATVRSKIIDDFTFQNFYNYIQLVASSLELYYFLDSILSYRSDTKDKNSGVLLMQTMFSDAELFTLQNELRRALKAHWFPEKYSQLIRWTYQIYKTSDLNQACNYMFCPARSVVDFNSATGGDTATLDYYKSRVKSVTDRLLNVTGTEPFIARVASVLAQIFPTGTIEGLPLSCSTASYDPKHYEIFVNQPLTWLSVPGSTTLSYYPQMLGPLGEVVYGISCEPGDGSSFPFCLQHIISTSKEYTTDFFRTRWHSISGEGENDSNKWTLIKVDDTTGQGYKFHNRLSYRWYPNESADVHGYDADPETGIPDRPNSVPKSGFQRAYFDTPNAPLINLRSLMDNIFGFI